MTIEEIKKFALKSYDIYIRNCYTEDRIVKQSDPRLNPKKENLYIEDKVVNQSNFKKEGPYIEEYMVVRYYKPIEYSIITKDYII